MSANSANEWIESLYGCVLPGVRPDQIIEQLTAATDRLTTLLSEPSVDASAVGQVAADLVTAGLSDPAVLSRSVPTLRGLVEQSGDSGTDRIDTVLGAFAEGFCRASLARAEGFEIAFRNASSAISIGDPDGHIFDVNPAFEQLTGVSLADLRYKTGYLLVPHEQRAEIEQEIRQAMNDPQPYTIEGPLPQADGTEIWVAWTVVPAESPTGERKYLLGFGDDITERHYATEQLRWQALHDPLTSLPNRRHLLDHLEAAATEAPAAYGVCVLDMDGFKPVNDAHGHRTGDHLLIEVAQRMKSVLTVDGCFLARVGGDEFVVVVAPPTDAAHVREILSAVQAAMREPFRIDASPIEITVSVGAVVGPLAGRDPTVVLDTADQALYEAKTRGASQMVLRSL